MIPDKSTARALAGLRAHWGELMESLRHDSDLDAEERAEPIAQMDEYRKREEDRRP